jgi:GDP-4-dehydro-6-deoxy-D-mannose reductase
MEKYLVTGASGFVSRYFLEYLESNNIHCHVVGIDTVAPDFTIDNLINVKFEFKKADLLNKESLGKLIQDFCPDYILHLASYSSVAYSWKNPVESFANNTNIFLNILEQVYKHCPECRILSIGSSEEYGNVTEKDLPLTEEHPLNPVSPYAVARVSQEMLSKVYANGYNLDVVMTRSFNHLGPGQKEVFVIPSFARQLMEIKSGKRKEFITGDTTIIRDFIDVRDVVRAYYLLFKKGKKGEIYNICSGKGTSLNMVISMMASELGIQVNPVLNKELVRPDDNRIIIGSNEKIKRETGWTNEISLEKSIKDILSELQKETKQKKTIAASKD